MKYIRNFAIIAHIDHGKSTLADRFLELTGVVEKGRHEEQLLDRNPISRERGITIKLAPVRMIYSGWKIGIEASQEDRNENLEKNQTSNFQFPNPFPNPTSYIINLIDTPGHVDFSYEVDRTLACVEGVILLVDATQGIQAQTISNAYKALEKNLVIIPAVNKIDLASADVKKAKKQLEDFLGIDPETSSGQVFEISAKTGKNTDKLLQAVIEKIPAPRQIQVHPSGVQALIFDSYYDSHRGVIAFVRVFQGKITRGLKVNLALGKQEITVLEVGYFSPELKQLEKITAGEIGYVVTNLKDIHQVRVGDTIVDGGSAPQILVPGYKKIRPMVYASIFPTDTNDFLLLKKALEKLYLNDSSLQFSTVHSKALGTGFLVGFLGLLHADVVRERLEREFNLSLILTPPQVDYQLDTTWIKDGKAKYREPWVKVTIVTPQKYLGEVMQHCQSYRAKFITMDNRTLVTLIYEMPMSEMISDFYDKLKSVSSGYASLDWEFREYRKVVADKLTLLLNGEPVEEFSEIVVEQRAFEKGQTIVSRLKEFIPRQQYEVKIQAQYKGKIIAAERIAPFRKDVTKKLYGGDRTRKDKLLDKQKAGKKKMKMIGRVEIPKEAFLKLFRKLT